LIFAVSFVIVNRGINNFIILNPNTKLKPGAKTLTYKALLTQVTKCHQC